MQICLFQLIWQMVPPLLWPPVAAVVVLVQSVMMWLIQVMLSSLLQCIWAYNSFVMFPIRIRVQIFCIFSASVQCVSMILDTCSLYSVHYSVILHFRGAISLMCLAIQFVHISACIIISPMWEWVKPDARNVNRWDGNDSLSSSVLYLVFWDILHGCEKLLCSNGRICHAKAEWILFSADMLLGSICMRCAYCCWWSRHLSVCVCHTASFGFTVQQQLKDRGPVWEHLVCIRRGSWSPTGRGRQDSMRPLQYYFSYFLWNYCKLGQVAEGGVNCQNHKMLSLLN